MLHAAVKKPLRDYINKRQAMVAEWVALRPIFEVCAKKTGYEGRGKVSRAMVAIGCYRTTSESHVKIFFGGSVGWEVTGIWKVW